MTYRDAVAALDARQETRIELGLERVRAYLRRLGSPQRRLACIHVAGTNGKGSVCAILESVLRAAGYKTGFYSSPHLRDVRERVRVCGLPISRRDFARLMARALAADGAGRLTYFELLTAVAFLHFVERKVDVVVLETGLGGRLDATNVIERPLACVVTSVDYDHMAFLGSTLAAIAAEKAGIFKRGCPAICPRLAPEAFDVVRAAAARAGAELVVVERPWPAARADWERGVQSFSAPAIGRVELGIFGEKQGLNAALAQAALSRAPGLRVSSAAWRRGLSRARWPGRFEVLRLGAKTAVLDGAHNAEAMRHLADTWRRSPWSSRPARWIIGVMKDKDARGLLAPVAPFLADVVAVRPPSARSLDAEALARAVREAAPRARVRARPEPGLAVEEWRAARGAPRTAVICGSFYLVGAVRGALGGFHA